MEEKLKISLFWNFIGSAITKIFTFSVTIVLTRTLSPEDFGIFAIAMVIMNILIELTRFGVESYIVYKYTDDKTLINSSFSFLLFLSILFSIVGILVSPLIGKFYNEPKVIFILSILSISLLIYPFYWLPTGILTKNMDFKTIALVNIISNFISACIIITLALNKVGIICLVLSTFLDKLIAGLLFLKVSNFKPAFNFNKTYWKEIYDYGKNVLGGVICWLAIFNLDNAIVGKFLGTKELGFYSFAYNLAMTPSIFLGIIFSQSTFPIFSRLKNEIEKFRKFFIKITIIMAILTIPLFSFLILFAKPLIIFIFGYKWSNSIIPFQILLIYSGLRLIFCFCPSCLRAIGRPDVEFKVGLIFLPISLIGFLIAVRYGIISMALTVTTILSLSPILLFYISFKNIFTMKNYFIN
jgi:O-antigen/teichoic acid export membrane protein